MPRKLRVGYAGAIYHVMNRGDRRELIFMDELDRERFLATLGEACAKTGWQVHAFCLMPNHFHLVVETPQPNLVAGMQWLLGDSAGQPGGAAAVAQGLGTAACGGVRHGSPAFAARLVPG